MTKYKTDEERVEELPINKCIVCGGCGWGVEADPSDPTGETPMQVQCDYCHAEGKITTLDCVRKVLTEVREEECQKREKAVEAERGRILKELSQYGINPPTMQSFVLNVHEFRKLITQPNNTK